MSTFLRNLRSRARSALGSFGRGLLRLIQATALVGALATLALGAWYRDDVLRTVRIEGGETLERLQHWSVRLPLFRVQSVEIRGGDYTDPEIVRGHLHLGDTASVWNRYKAARARIDGLPGILDAKIERKLPSTLVVSIREARPVAEIQTPDGIRWVAENGELLPRSASTGSEGKLPRLDGPFATLQGERLRHSPAVESLRALHRLQQSGLPWTREIHTMVPQEDGSFGIQIRAHGETLILLPRALSQQRISWLEATLKDFQTRFGESRRPVRVDLRFEDQIIVQHAPHES